jgi:hypothetical protein
MEHVIFSQTNKRDAKAEQHISGREKLRNISYLICTPADSCSFSKNMAKCAVGSFPFHINKRLAVQTTTLILDD